jgi:hypothetical protein
VLYIPESHVGTILVGATITSADGGIVVERSTYWSPPGQF